MQNWEVQLGTALEGDREDALKAAVETAQAALREQREQLSKILTAQPEELQQRLLRDRAGVEQCFEDYFHWLGLCQAYLQEGAPSWLESARSHFEAVSGRFNVGLAQLDEALYAERGPYTHPGLNRLFQAIDSAQLEGYLDALEREWGRNERLFADDDLAVQLRAQLLPCELAALESYRALLEEAPDDRFPDDTWQDRAEHIGEQLAQCDREMIARRCQSSPTYFPALNVAVNSVWWWEQGRLHRELPVYFLEQAHLMLTELQAQVPDFLQEIIAVLLEDVEDLSLLRPGASAEVVPSIIENASSYQKEIGRLVEPPAGSSCGVCGHPVLGERCLHCGTRT